MKKIILAFLLLALLLPAVGCAAQEEKERVTVVATTYPIYRFARAGRLYQKDTGSREIGSFKDQNVWK